MRRSYGGESSKRPMSILHSPWSGLDWSFLTTLISPTFEEVVDLVEPVLPAAGVGRAELYQGLLVVVDVCAGPHLQLFTKQTKTIKVFKYTQVY